MSALAIALTACGLSQRQAAAFLKVREDTVNKCAAGKSRVPPGWLVELKALSDQIERAAQAGLAQIENASPGTAIELGFAVDDHEARSLGWPCASAQIASLSRIWAALPSDRQVIFVPRGATKMRDPVGLAPDDILKISN
jgi:hypothetical protein